MTSLADGYVAWGCGSCGNLLVQCGGMCFVLSGMFRNLIDVRFGSCGRSFDKVAAEFFLRSNAVKCSLGERWAANFSFGANLVSVWCLFLESTMGYWGEFRDSIEFFLNIRCSWVYWFSPMRSSS